MMFFSAELRNKVAECISRSQWAADLARLAEENAQWWLERSDDELWSLMFGPTIERSWMVWSNGFCPECKQDVRMYEWKMDPKKHPWKTSCPHCGSLFPKNDFQTYYLSGLDKQGIFDHSLADRSLLYNTEHPDPEDPLHNFGLDDGNGYSDGNNLWRFIGAYLVYGQWKILVLEGLSALAAAYVVTNKNIYAHKAAVMLDRIADLHPLFDYGKQAYVYEVRAAAGYVSTWHDACEECMLMGLAYDAIRDGINGDDSLVAFLHAKSTQMDLPNAKESIEDIKSNIHANLFTDVLTDPDDPSALYNPKIKSNFPASLVTAILLKAIDQGEQGLPAVLDMIDKVLDTACKYDGLTGERGMIGYASIGPRHVAALLGYFMRADDSFLGKMLERHPRLYDMYRFHIDTWCLDGNYYPQVGDSHYFASKYSEYAGVRFNKTHGIGEDLFSPFLGPSMVSFLYGLYKETRDKDFLKVIDRWCKGDHSHLPYDLFVENPEQIRMDVAAVVSESRTIEPPSSLKREWGLCILRSGQEQNSRALWVCTSTGGSHSHANGMNLGLFGHGLDLLPDFGYPPVQFGGWGSERAMWYRRTAAHNTVMVDCKDDVGYEGFEVCADVTEWSCADGISYMIASGPEMAGVERYERTCALADISKEDFYVVDVFRVKGGSDHSRMLHSHFGTTTTNGLSLEPVEPFCGGLCMRGFMADKAPKLGWSVDWKIEDKLGYLPADIDLHLRLTDLTENSIACTCEGWVQYGGYWTKDETWIPFVISRRTSQTSDLESTFVSIIEPYRNTPAIKSARRLDVENIDGKPLPDSTVALDIQLTNGSRDIWIFQDPQDCGKVRLVCNNDIISEAKVLQVRL